MDAKEPNPPLVLEALEDIASRITAALDRSTIAIARLAEVMEQNAEPEVPFVMQPPSPKGTRLQTKGGRRV
jgi:hypothetical protein